MSTLRSLSLVIGLSLATHAAIADSPDPKPVFDSKVITTRTPGHAVAVDVPLGKAKQVFLVAHDAGDGYGFDWANWAEPRFVGPGTEIKATDLKWKSATAGWGRVHKNRNANGGPLSIASQPVKYGIGTHANSLIVFDVPRGATHFKARAGLDNGGTEQGDAGSVRFMVFLEKPAAFANSSKANNDIDRTPDSAVAGLKTGDGLETTLFAAEPLMLSPANCDVDHLGRVWVCEVVNYRAFRNKHKMREEGDRILILEDTDSDGKADAAKVFYQGRDIDSAHGVCVLGNRVIVSANDSVMVLTDDDGDDKADRKDILFTGISGTQHDHGIHAFVFGPDGKLYFNFGNAGKQLKDKHGKPIVDMAGNTIDSSRRPYQEGMVFRCNMDGSDVETLGWNFRNNWEISVDSFGTLWQSDNDDDGNRGTRINFVMEFGNYGYKDEFTGAGWRDNRTGIESEIPLRHWHLNDPGVVPNLLQTGAGSPTGICIYEGNLLPKVFQNQIIHCDAGPNVVRAYPVSESGAGYKASVENILVGETDKWFRPSDVCVAPDGSLIIADWYDPGVGGHAMGDPSRGRLFRVAPPGASWKVPKHDFSTIDGAITALKSPNHATRYLAYTALSKQQQKAESALLKVFREDKNPRFRARALWLLGQIKGQASHYIEQALADSDANIRITGLRLARRTKTDLLASLDKSVDDSSAAVLRECAVALRHLDSPKKPSLWSHLAKQYDGQDRWYLEALGIAAGKHWDQCLAAYLNEHGDDFRSKATRDIVWRSRAQVTPQLLAKIVREQQEPVNELARYFRAYDFLAGNGREEALAELAFSSGKLNGESKGFVMAESVNRLQNFDINSKPEYRAAVDSMLGSVVDTPQFAAVVDRFNLKERYGDLLTLAQKLPGEQAGVDAVRVLLKKGQMKALRQAMQSDAVSATSTATALANSGDGRAANLLIQLVTNKDYSIPVRREAVRGAAKSKQGSQKLVALAQQNQLEKRLRDAAASALTTVPFRDIKQVAQKLFPPAASKDNQPVPPIAQLIKMGGNMKNGRLVFNTTGECHKCHIVNKLGRDVGPDLSEIGNKLSRTAMFQSILYPSAGVSHNYETWAAVMDDGTVFTGLKVSETDNELTLKNSEGLTRKLSKGDIDELTKQDVSLMPADLQKTMTIQELVDVVDYLQSLKK